MGYVKYCNCKKAHAGIATGLGYELVKMGILAHFLSHAKEEKQGYQVFIGCLEDLQRKDKMAGRAQAIWTLLGTCVK